MVKRYKKKDTGPAKGMMIDYKPSLRIIKGSLCPEGTLDDKLAALRKACIIASWTDKLSDARIASNTRVYNAFRSEFGNEKLQVLSSPRMQFLASQDVAVNLQPELYAEVDGTLMMWKFGMCRDSRPRAIYIPGFQPLGSCPIVTYTPAGNSARRGPRFGLGWYLPGLRP